MASKKAEPDAPKRRSLWVRIPLAAMNLILAILALWLGMSIPSYFRSVSPLVLEAAAAETPGLADLAEDEIQSGRPGLARTLIEVAEQTEASSDIDPLRKEIAALLEQQPLYRWSGGPAPFYEQFLKGAPFLREDERAVIPTLLPAENRRHLLGFLAQSANRNVQAILETRRLGGWSRFYPVYSTSGHPLEATILTAALLEQASAFPADIRKPLLGAVNGANEGNPQALAELETLYIGILTIGRYADWLQLKTLVQSMETSQQLLFAAQSVQEEKARFPILLGALLNAPLPEPIVNYLNRYGERGWAGLTTAMGMGRGAVLALLQFDKPLYDPPGFWKKLPAFVHDGQQRFKGFAETFPTAGIAARVLAFGFCGIFLVGILRTLVLGWKPGIGSERRLLINLDSIVGAILVTMLVWILIEPGLMDFQPNEQGTLEINLAQILPEQAQTEPEKETPSMIDQVTILVLLLFFVAQLLVFIFGLMKLAEVRRQPVTPEVKLRLLDNEENLFDLGLYVGLGGTVASLILVVLNVVDASLMAAYASTLFGIIFVAILKVGFLRPFRRRVILERN